MAIRVRERVLDEVRITVRLGLQLGSEHGPTGVLRVIGPAGRGQDRFNPLTGLELRLGLHDRT